MHRPDVRTETAPSLLPRAGLSFGVVILEGDAQRFVPLEAGAYDIGREDDCDVRLLDQTASRRHARIVVGDEVTIEDLDSKNGTRLEGRRLDSGVPTRVRIGAAIEICDTLIILQRGSARLAASLDTDVPRSPSASEPSWLAFADRIAADDVPVLILGETGVGKDVLASRLHEHSRRASGPFVRLHPAAISPSLFESELFGHERGAFTSASRDHVGLVERSEGGTLFIDEIGELSLDGQVKLLRLLEDRVVRRVGARTERPVDVRFLAATNRDLEEEIVHGRFRADLYFRLAGVVLRVPPLRDRRSELRSLAETFLSRWCASRDRIQMSVDDSAWAELERYTWPGNVRELRVVVEHAALVCDGMVIRASDLPNAEMQRRASSIPMAQATVRGITPEPLARPPKVPDLDALGEGSEARRERIREALANAAGNQTEAAKRLGVTRRTLSNWLNELQMPRPRKGNVAER